MYWIAKMLCEQCETVFRNELTPSEGKRTIYLTHTTFTSWKDIEVRATNCYVCQSCVLHKQNEGFQIAAEDQYHVTFHLNIYNEQQNQSILNVWIGPGRDTKTAYTKIWFNLYPIPAQSMSLLFESRYNT